MEQEILAVIAIISLAFLAGILVGIAIRNGKEPKKQAEQHRI
jgi:hypothetical protein